MRPKRRSRLQTGSNPCGHSKIGVLPPPQEDAR